MMDYSLERIKEHLEKNIGDIGYKMFKTSLSDLNISENPTSCELENLILDLENKLVKFCGKPKSKELFESLQNELIQEQKSYESELYQKLNEFFALNGIPREIDIINLVNYLHSKGYKIETTRTTRTLEQISKDRIVCALSEKIISMEIRSFLNRTLSYSQEDVEQFIKYLQLRKLRINDSAIMETIERERLLKKFNDTNHEESPNDKICRQFFERVNSGNKNHYGYLVMDEEIGKLAQIIAKKGLFRDEVKNGPNSNN